MRDAWSKAKEMLDFWIIQRAVQRAAQMQFRSGRKIW